MAKHLQDSLSVSQSIVFVFEQEDELTAQGPVRWAVGHLKEVLQKQGIKVSTGEALNAVEDVDLYIRVGGKNNGVPEEAESFCLVREDENGKPTLCAAGADERGLVYALLELADIAEYADNPISELLKIERTLERPANPIRSIARPFVNEADDKTWFYDKSFWQDYLTELVSQRFNRFSFTFSIGYNHGHDPDYKCNYFLFPYPYLLSVPGYNVTVRELPEGEAERNLQMLRWIGQEVKRRGLHFHVGLWMNSYELIDSPNAHYSIEGLNAENHCPYVRDALQMLLNVIPEIDGITLRVHYEGGISEPAHEFWKVVIGGIAESGRKLEIDLHPKGLTQELLKAVTDTGYPVTISPKYWQEHQGLPYHQVAIREMEMIQSAQDATGWQGVTVGQRRFTRYGYADFLRQDRPYGVLHRIWPGTQRFLLWGDPALASGFGRFGQFCGSKGVEFLCEPLGFKSRKTSNTANGRNVYADASLVPENGDWRKYLYTYRLWGRHLYNPNANPESWRRMLRKEFGAAAEACEKALGYASRILLYLTAAHLPTASNDVTWMELPSMFPITKKEIVTKHKSKFRVESLDSNTFNYISPGDPGLFYRIADFADEVLQGHRSGKYSPLEVADCLDALADGAERNMAEAKAKTENKEAPAFRRWFIDVAIQAGTGRFFARKFRAGLAYAFYEKTGDTELLKEALQHYRSAQNAWEQLVEITRDVYVSDITFGSLPSLRGNWADRLPDLVADIAAMEEELENAGGQNGSSKPVVAAAKAALERESAPRPAFVHTPQESVRRGNKIVVKVAVPEAGNEIRVRLHYRHVNQAERYTVIEMSREGCEFTAEIPGSYTDSTYPVLYFFEGVEDAVNVWFAPGLSTDLSNQPYYVVHLS